MKLNISYVLISVFMAFMIYFHAIELYLYRSALEAGLGAVIPFFLALILGLVCNIIFGIYSAYLLPKIPCKYNHKYVIISLICLICSWILVSLCFFYEGLVVVDIFHAMIPLLISLFFYERIKKKHSDKKSNKTFVVPIFLFSVLAVLLFPILRWG